MMSEPAPAKAQLGFLFVGGKVLAMIKPDISKLPAVDVLLQEAESQFKEKSYRRVREIAEEINGYGFPVISFEIYIRLWDVTKDDRMLQKADRS